MPELERPGSDLLKVQVFIRPSAWDFVSKRATLEGRDPRRQAGILLEELHAAVSHEVAA